MRNAGMNRGKGLKSSSSLGSSNNSLGGGGRLVPRKTLGARVGLKARSKKKALWYKEERAPFVADFLNRNPQCAFKLWVHGTTIEESPSINLTGGIVTLCGKRADDIHEILPQGRGGAAVPVDGDESNCIGLCRTHHIFVTQHPAWSRAKGYTQ